MPILVKDLYQDAKQQYQMKLIAGEDGLDRIVNWFYIAEDIGNISFLEGAELVISTGFASSLEQDWLPRFVKALIEKNTSGLILNVGKYIRECDIPETVITLCETQRFPLFTVPWEVHLSELSQTYCNQIFAYRQRTYNIENAISSILLEGKISPRTQKTLEKYAYLPSDTYTLAVIEPKCETESLDQYDQLLRQVTAFCPTGRNLKFVLVEYQRQTVIVWHNAGTTAIKAHIAELSDTCQTTSLLRNVRIGLSQTRTGLELLKMYRQAAAALTMAEYKKQPWYHFDDLGCFSVFLEAKDRETLQEYYQKQLDTLEDYDEAHGGCYLETLECYLKYDRHLAKAAAALVCHKNTVSYRINKIRDMLNLDFDDGNAMFQLQLALQIRRFLQIYHSSL
ncbi:MAG: PucR family transcriptional regulator [Clostridiales bacterium]|nr:PucR family transcriptional regulator [Clostridiales bacterium]